ncbi:hypothetical protein KVR01_004758 [Diaporthe batatas]|uniref:uncharacterized protein n=1 Tax=Diaporthe batatas TaxID=748121 RepID=UPI001D054D24|nr:uncharacterized protein KVR01_004758 [Diaporthe batatas]KAG8166206.1 hypothetical protein KVR01_004758 [Diaporthe batatas]
MDKWHGPFPPRADRESYLELYERMTLTPLGRTTAVVLMKGVRSLHSAHLLAQLLDTEQETQALNKTSSPVVEAILALSVLTEVNASDITTLFPCIKVEDWSRGDMAWYDNKFRGISKRVVGRGPLWLAVGLWHILMTDNSLRGPLSHLNEASISIHVEKTTQWDLRLSKLSKICTTLLDMDKVDGLGLSPLTDEEFMAVEVALVRAFMDRIVVVEYHEAVNAEGARGWKYQAWDLASGQSLGMPPLSQNFHVWWDYCHRIEETAAGEKSPVIFCVYSFLIYCIQSVDDGSSPKVRAPLDATYVSGRAVRLAFEGTDSHAKVSDPMSYIESLKQHESQEGRNEEDTTT